jgi:hypothetical protein
VNRQILLVIAGAAVYPFIKYIIRPLVKAAWVEIAHSLHEETSYITKHEIDNLKVNISINKDAIRRLEEKIPNPFTIEDKKL